MIGKHKYKMYILHSRTILYDYINMETLLDGTYVINMDSDIDRLEQFDTMMMSSNWNYSRYSAINGKKLLSSWSDITDPDEFNMLRDQLIMKKTFVSTLNFLSNSEIGCLLSHISLWKEVANNPEKNRIAIFEDDARTHIQGDTIYKLLSEFYNYLEINDIPEPDMLYLGKSLDDCMSYEKVWGNVYKSKHPICLHAYIITKKGAQKLLQMAPYNLAIDMVPIKAIKKGIIEVMAFHPSIYFQDVINNTSNLRKKINAINNTSDCLVSQQHITEDNWLYTIVIFIGLIATVILFVLFLWRFWPLVYSLNI